MLSIKNVICYQLIRIEYIFIRLCCALCRKKALNKKLSFSLLKKKSLFESEEKVLWNDFFFFFWFFGCFGSMLHFY
jgi:hypothetical protein